ncbi:amidohydrolase family protein [Actinomycetospora sp. TBRC 11914]|uniref:amidohydrolase family protein n=1 Tax=Actinomycetospora sp. TBRC 11914 TaxID=2729387 RepID=UPI00145C5A58|nr:amidohydrolase family protein [Actinomycetospora sp. TBRC 11914]NMO90451.1 amidohydrolase family protein [Actinomycetospora sp. TBRC 11914]
MSTTICGARIFDGERTLGVGTVVVDGDVVTAVEPGVREPADGEVDARGATLLPGLVDGHVHLRGAGNLGQDLRHGVTTVLDMFSAPPQFTAMLRARAARRDDEADLRSSGLMAGAADGWPAVMLPPDPSGWRMPGLSGPQDAERFVADRVREGSDYLKVFVENAADVTRPTLSAETVAAVCAAARSRGLTTVAHAPTRWAFATARAAGVDVLTHLPLDGPLEDDGGLGGLTVVPTMTMMAALSDATSQRALFDDPRLTARLPSDVVAALRAGDRGGLPTSSAPGAAYEHAADNLRRLLAAGATVVAGTDANDVPGRPAAVLHGASLHLELELLARCGMAPGDVLAAATSRAAAVFGLADRGRIAVGRRADLLLVDGDPTVDVTATRALRTVWRAGVPHDLAHPAAAFGPDRVGPVRAGR